MENHNQKPGKACGSTSFDGLTTGNDVFLYHLVLLYDSLVTESTCNADNKTIVTLSTKRALTKITVSWIINK